jgi:hypothetical protein
VFQIYHERLFAEIFCRYIFVVFLFHTLFNWAHLLYQQPMPTSGLISGQAYVAPLVQDWHLRSQSPCFLNRAHESARGLVALVSWL